MNEAPPQPIELHAHRSNPIFLGPEGLRAGWSLLLYAVLLVLALATAREITGLLPHASHATVKSNEQSPRSLFLGESIPFLLLTLVAWIMSKIERRPFGVYGLGGPRKLPHFLAGLGSGVAFLSLLVLILKLTGLLVFDTRLLFGAAILRFGLIWAGNFVFVALLEDFLTRGYLQFTLARGLSGLYRAVHAPNSQALGFWTAALLLSIAFGLGHSSNPGESPIGLFAAGLAGLVFCLSLWRTGSLWWAIGAHTSWDWAQSFLYGVPDSGTMVEFHLFATHPVGKPLFSGGATGPEGSLFILPILAGLAAVIVLTLPKRQSAFNS